MLYVLDTETTGVDHEKDAVVEVAAVPVCNDGAIVPKFLDSYVNPGIPIPPSAQGVHHISDAMVKNAPTLTELFKIEIFEPLLAAKTYVAHNAEFDRGFLAKIVNNKTPWICTWRCARHLFPDSPDHKNQTLRYYLGLDIPAKLLKGRAPHSALYDTIVTAHILQRMLSLKSVDELIALTAAPVLIKKVGFGAHFGKPWSDVPADYLRWVLRNDFDSDTLHTARHWAREKLGATT